MPKYLSLQSVREEYADIETRTLRDMIHRGDIEASKIGRKWYISREELERVFTAAKYRPRKRVPLRVRRH